MTINNYFAAETKLGKRASRKIANNTYLIKLSDGTIVIKLHNTYIASYFPPNNLAHGRIELNSGGWQTATTKNRLNEWTPARISQKNWAWTVHNSDGTTTDFVDRMTIPEQYGFGVFAREA